VHIKGIQNRYFIKYIINFFMNKHLFLLAILFIVVKTQAQNIGIGTFLPKAKLHINGGLLLDSTNGNTPVSGAGTRLMWIPAKAAFRAGIINSTEWDDANIGLYSTAIGNGTMANGVNSTAMGYNSFASNNGSTAMGSYTMASGNYSTTMGSYTKASGNYSTAIGGNTTASGDYSTALGISTTASGLFSTATGYFTKSKSYAGLTVGLYNDSTNAGNSTSNNSLNRIFQIGNGTADNARRNAMTVLQNGNVGIGTTDPVALLHSNNGAVLFDGTIGSTPVSGPGTRMMWIPAKAAFRAGTAPGYVWDDANIGSLSFATGISTTASGYASTAIGGGTTASNDYSTAMGFNTNASGAYSTSMGYSTKSKSYAGFVTGIYNDSTNATDSYANNSLNRVFQIGNGTADNARSNAMTVLQNGSVGIGTTDPLALLHTKNGAILFDGTTGSTPVSGPGSRLMWIPNKAAFRAGSVGSEWDDANIGLYSIAFGNGTKANGVNSTAMGTNTTASGNWSTAMGSNTTASDYYSTAIGWSTIANSYASTAMGTNTTASGNWSTAMGSNTTASGDNSTAMGLFTKSKSFGGFAGGTYNDSTNAASKFTINSLNRIFQIGNGTADNARSNAMTVLQNGNVGIGTVNPIAPLNFASSLGDKIIMWTNGTTHYGMGVQPSLYQLFTDTQGADIAFGYGNSSSFTENMRIKGNGNVGIGTTNPSYMLTVKNDIDLDNSDGNAGTIANALKFGGNGSGEAIGSNRTTAINQFGLDFYTNSVNRIAISLGGNVGIGTTAPSAKLSVNGSANNATGTWGVFSDARVKNITGNFIDGLNVISQINPIVFNYNDYAPFKTSDEQIGIVAQDLEKIAPYMVSKQAYNQFADLREVNNQAYVFLLINAVKEQQQQIAKQQVQLASQQKENTLLQLQVVAQQKESKVQKERMDTLEKFVYELCRKVN
jgi:hypothetical protein